MDWGLVAAIVTVLAWVCGLIVATVTIRAWAERRRRRRRKRAQTRLDVGAVSSDWLAKQKVNRDGWRP